MPDNQRIKAARLSVITLLIVSVVVAIASCKVVPPKVSGWEDSRPVYGKEESQKDNQQKKSILCQNYRAVTRSDDGSISAEFIRLSGEPGFDGHWKIIQAVHAFPVRMKNCNKRFRMPPTPIMPWCENTCNGETPITSCIGFANADHYMENGEILFLGSARAAWTSGNRFFSTSSLLPNHLFVAGLFFPSTMEGPIELFEITHGYAVRHKLYQSGLQCLSPCDDPGFPVANTVSEIRDSMRDRLGDRLVDVYVEQSDPNRNASVYATILVNQDSLAREKATLEFFFGKSPFWEKSELEEQDYFITRLFPDGRIISPTHGTAAAPDIPPIQEALLVGQVLASKALASVARAAAERATRSLAKRCAGRSSNELGAIIIPKKAKPRLKAKERHIKDQKREVRRKAEKTPGGHQQQKIVEDITKSKENVRIAAERARRDPSIENVEALEDAQQQLSEIKAVSDKIKRQDRLGDEFDDSTNFDLFEDLFGP